MENMLKSKAVAVGTVTKAVSATRPLVANAAAITSLVLIDLAAITFAILIAYFLRDNILPLLSPALFSDKLLDNTFQILWWYPLAFIFCLAYEKLYTKRLPFWIEVESILKALTLAFFSAVAFIYIIGLGDVVSRAMVIMIWFLNLFLIPTFRHYGKKLLLRINVWNCPVLIVGNVFTTSLLQRAFTRERTMGYEVIGSIEVPEEEKPCNRGESGEGCDGKALEQGRLNFGDADQRLTRLGSVHEAEEIIKKTKVQDVIIAVSGIEPNNLVDLTNRFQPLVNNLFIMPNLFGITLNGIDLVYLFEEQAIFLQIKNRLKSPLSRAVKRLFDLTAGSLAFLLSLPVILIAALLIKLDSPGPVFFVSERIGQQQKKIFTYKFRTMYLESDQILARHLSTDETARREWEEYRKLKTYDPRVTRVGRLLRKFSIDELPQIFNVLRNEMSLVGPRPYLPSEREQIGSWAPDIHVTKPGITGLWQVSGRNELSFDSRLRLDAWYVKNWSLWLDTVLMLKTVRVVLKSDGAY